LQLNHLMQNLTAKLRFSAESEFKKMKSLPNCLSGAALSGGQNE
jgi:hypothetical protein